MNVTVIDTIKLVIQYLEGKAAGTALADNIFTGPNEQRVNNSKYFICVLYEYKPTETELGDAVACYEITCQVIMGYRIDAHSTAGTEKELGDTWMETYIRYLRSMTFKRFMAQNGVKVPPNHIERANPDKFAKEFEGIMRENVTLKLWTYITTLEEIP